MRTLLRGCHVATMAAPTGYGALHDGAVLVDGGHIAWVGAARGLPAGLRIDAERDLGGAWLLPGLIDCHTHLVYAGQRADEFEQRLEGVPYAEIARRGGGIRSTVRAVRAADVDDLVRQSAPRLDRLVADGVTTVEIKSGYGLSLDAERRMLQAARRLGDRARVCTTFLGLHAVPPELDAEAWVAEVEAMLPILAAEGLVDAVDAFCETIGFSPAQVARVFDRARALGLPVKLHAEQLSDQGGAALVARYGGLSADHLEWLSAEGVAAMAAAGTVAVLLPGAFYCLRETRLPPVEALRAAGVPMAVATDNNPGTSPMSSLLLALSMACTLFRLTPAEALAGVTRHAARALGLYDVGMIAPGQRADLAAFAVGQPAELCYHLGLQPLVLRMLGGEVTHARGV
jgi:imidazolonepropionase